MVTTAASSAGSSTRIMSSHSARMISRLIAPGLLTAIPSARVWPPAAAARPFNALWTAGYIAASTPITSISGLIALAAVATPEISPPPPTGMINTARSGLASSISSPTVPWPAITAGSAKGCTKVRPSVSASAMAWGSALLTSSPCSTTVAPKASVRRILLKGVPLGMTMVAGMPSRCACQATPWAWLPADTAITPACACAPSRLNSLASAPRSLNDPVRCRVSSFR